MTLKHKSDAFRYGDTNPGHVLAVDRIVKFCKDNFKNQWEIDEGWSESYSPKFVSENKDRNKTYWGHNPDIAFWEWNMDQPVLKLVIEVDGESHDSKTRKISDGIFEKWIGTHYKGYVKVIRIQKRELVGPLDLAEEELRDKLGEFLK